MKLYTELSKYISQYYISSIFISTIVLLLAVFIGDLVEYFRIAGSKENVGMGIAIKLAFLHLPFMLQETIPYAILFGSIFWISRLTKNQELIIMRSTGLSLWQIFLPGTFLAACIGVFNILAFNPLVAATQTKLQQIENNFLRSSINSLSVSGSGFWLRQAIANGTDVLYAREVNAKEMKLIKVTIYRFDQENNITQRIDAESAELKEKYWDISNALITNPLGRSFHNKSLKLNTLLTKSQIQEGFTSPETMSLWTLIPFIKMLNKAGFSAKKHRLYFHNLLTLPFLLVGMTILGSSINIKPPRNRVINLRLIMGISFGFAMFYLMTIIEALGLSGKVYIEIAAWLPAFIPVFLGISLLLHMEET